MNKYEQLNSKEIADIIGDSREYLEKNGWWKGQVLGPNKKQVCAWGAILYGNGLTEATQNVAYDMITSVHLAVDALVTFVPAVDTCCDRHFRSNELNVLVHWNDEHAKDKQEVLDLFAKAEKVLRNDGIDPDA